MSGVIIQLKSIFGCMPFICFGTTASFFGAIPFFIGARVAVVGVVTSGFTLYAYYGVVPPGVIGMIFCKLDF